MRKVKVSMYVTLDGFMDNPAWTAPYFNEEVGNFQTDLLFSSDTLLLGRVTYEGMAAAWPTMTDDVGFADRMNGYPKYVASTTLEEGPWNATMIKGDIVEEVAKLKQKPGQDILIYGSADLIHTLMEHDLIDEYHFMIQPVVHGSGKRLFKDGSYTKALKLVEVKTTSTGVSILSYQPEKKN
ncbi:MAG: dihydrofolate reductase family protein [Candidatus Pristimantibacillus sp.]